MADSGLVDEFGDPISRATIAAMRADIAPIGGQHGRPPFAGHMAWGIDPGRLATIVKAADAGSSLKWFILAEEIEELFTHYASVLAKRRRQVAQLPITVTAATGETDAERAAFEEHAELIRCWLDTGVLQGALFDILDAIGKGFSAHSILWEQTPDHVWPCALLYKPQRFFEFSYIDATTLWLRTEAGYHEPPPHQMLIHRHPSKSGNLVRSGLTRMVVFLWCYATYTLKDWALFAQVYGLPIRVGKYGAGASDTDKRTLLRAVASIAGDVAAMIPESMQIEFVEATDRAAGASLYEKRMDWLNREISKLGLGGTAGTEALHGGHAVGQEHRQAEQDVERFDAGLINRTINAQIVRTIVALTCGPQRGYPQISIGRPDEVPLEKITEAIRFLAPFGLKVKASQILEKLQLDPPEDGDDVIGIQAAPSGQPTDSQADATDDADAEATEEDDDAEATDAATGFLRRVVTLTATLPEREMDALIARLARDAAGAMHGLTEPVRAAFAAADSMHDLARRLHRLKLPAKALAEAMSRGMALAHLVGQATVIEETRGA